MNDYKFDDPYDDLFDFRILDEWEEKANGLVKKSYEARGWVLQSPNTEKNM